jgi:hypothetical protein
LADNRGDDDLHANDYWQADTRHEADDSRNNRCAVNRNPNRNGNDGRNP